MASFNSSIGSRNNVCWLINDPYSQSLLVPHRHSAVLCVCVCVCVCACARVREVAETIRGRSAHNCSIAGLAPIALAEG